MLDFVQQAVPLSVPLSNWLLLWKHLLADCYGADYLVGTSIYAINDGNCSSSHQGLSSSYNDNSTNKNAFQLLMS